MELKLAQNLNFLMRKQSLALRTLSDRTGIPYSTLYTWLDHRAPKDLLKVKILAEHFHMKVDDLLFGDLASSSTAHISERLVVSDSLEGVYEITVRKIKGQ